MIFHKNFSLAVECEVESILAAKKKRLDKDKQDRLDELKNSLERHRFHVTKLETLMRMLDNLASDISAVSPAEIDTVCKSFV